MQRKRNFRPSGGGWKQKLFLTLLLCCFKLQINIVCWNTFWREISNRFSRSFAAMQCTQLLQNTKRLCHVLLRFLVFCVSQCQWPPLCNEGLWYLHLLHLFRFFLNFNSCLSMTWQCHVDRANNHLPHAWTHTCRILECMLFTLIVFVCLKWVFGTS